MGEKKGSTEKLKYDFPTEKECQVLLNNKWYRATPRDFRSWGSARRIIYYDKNNQPDYEEYNGPVYYWNTNKICKEPDNNGVQYIYNMPFRSVVRPGEHKFLDK
jgi:hypothetical protein